MESVGKGIALGERFKYDTTSGTAALNRALYDKAIYDRNKKDQAVSEMDFKIDYNVYKIPAYAKAARDVQADIYNKYAKYKQEDKATALNRIQSDILNARQELSRLKADSDGVYNYVSQGEGMLRNSEFIKAAKSTDTNIEDLAKYNDNYFLNIGQRGEFAYRPVKEIVPSALVKYDPQDYDKVIGKTKRSSVPGKMEVEYVEMLKPEAIQRNAEALMQNDDFKNNVYASRPDLLNLPPLEREKAAYGVAFDIASKMKRPSQSEWKLESLPAPRSDADDKPKEEPVFGGATKETLPDVNNVGENTESTIPWTANVSKSPAISIALDGRVIDAQTNKFVTGTNLNQIITFSPKVTYPQLMKNGKTELYVLGTMQQEELTQSGEKIVKSFNYKIPYDKVEQSIKAAYNDDKIKQKFSETKLTSPNKNQSAPKPTKGKLY